MCKEVQSAIRSQQTGGASEAGTARAQENAEIESSMRDLDDAIARMDRELESGNYPDDEYNKRRGLLGDLTKKTSDLRKLPLPPPWAQELALGVISRLCSYPVQAVRARSESTDGTGERGLASTGHGGLGTTW
jgi:hypothetical protein